MIVIPAIDLKEGRCVRLYQGDMNQSTVYDDDPAARAASFLAAGFKRLHVVDLDGALLGKPTNVASVKAILAAVGTNMPVQIGGGIRSLQAIETWLNAGAHAVILGTVAIKNPELVVQACAAFKGQIIVGIDARNGFVATEGWAEGSTRTAADVAQEAAQAGAAAIVYTDIGRDGTLQGINIDATNALSLQVPSVPVIASGGLGSVNDIIQLRHTNNAGIMGVIAGKALYDGRLDPAQALAAAAGAA